MDLAASWLDILALDDVDVYGHCSRCIIGFDWILLGLGVFADMAGYFGSYRHRESVPYGDQIP